MLLDTQSATQRLRTRLRQSPYKHVAVAKRAGVTGATLSRFVHGGNALWGTQESIRQALDAIEDEAIALRLESA